MIRPITLLMFVLACGSGMFLYNEKHRTHVLDQQIDQTIRQTEAMREQTHALHAEWMLLNDPDRLRRLSTQYLPGLQPVSPTQFTDLADLDSRLPAPVPPAAAPPPGSMPGRSATPAPLVAATPGQTRVEADAETADNQTAPAAGAQTDGAQTTATQPAATQSADTQTGDTQTGDTQTGDTQTGDTQSADTQTTLPMPPAAPPAPPPALPAQVATAAPPPQHDHPVPQPVVAQAAPIRPQPVAAAAVRPSPWRPATPHPVIAEANPPRFVRPAPRPMPLAPRPQPVAAPIFSGSMLGMAHSTQNLPAPQPLPRPVPMNAAYDPGAGG
ncbi:MAG TPA: hypothetical protein VGG99_28845 [Acetobacteraceae bacterium]